MNKVKPEYLDITWESIFTRKVRNGAHIEQRDCLRVLPMDFRTLQEKHTRIDLADDYIPGTKKPQTKEFSCGYPDTAISRFWNGSSDAHQKFEKIKDNLIHHAKHSNYSFDDSPLIEDMIKNIAKLLVQVPKEELDEQTVKVRNSFVEGLRHKDKKYQAFIKVGILPEQIDRAFANNPISDTRTLCSLLLIASTWELWERASVASTEEIEALRILAHIIFPSNAIQIEKHTSAEWISDRKEKEAEDARSAINRAKEHYTAREYEDCVADCLSVIRLNFADDKDLGAAYYYAVICRKKHGVSWPGKYDETEWIARAQSLGNEMAIHDWKISHIDSLVYEPVPYSGKAKRFFMNTNNDRTAFFMSSLSREKDTGCICSVVEKDWAGALRQVPEPGQNVFLLLDEDQEKNYYDLISILNLFRGAYSTEMDTLIEDVEIYIRVSSEKYAGLIDTAMKQMNGVVVPVHILDESKLTAQHLLATHPLFYPIRSLPNHTLNNKQVVLNLVIICESKTDLAMWIAREAYWLGCFWYQGIHVEITIVSVNAKEINESLRFLCSGIFSGETDESVSSVSVSVVPLSGSTISTSELFGCLEGLATSANYFPYYVIAAKDDVSGLNLGIQLREWNIRSIVRKGGKIGKTDLPVIAFHCEDDNIAHLAEKMVVQTADHGDSWFNNYCIIPFGMRSEMYGGQQLMRDYFELAARATHLQYNYIKVQATKEQVNGALVSFYNRYYNYDSSKAAALSLPYRLFMAKDKLPGFWERDHITPDGWSISDADVYTDLSEMGSVGTMADAFASCIECNTEILGSLTRYEHARWTRWMISRGWIPSTTEETVTYMLAGNPKQQLFVARMHSCMIPFDKLGDLQADLYANGDRGKQFDRFKDEKGKYDYFTKFDKDSIRMTPDIMRLAWPAILDEAEDEEEE